MQRGKSTEVPPQVASSSWEAHPKQIGSREAHQSELGISSEVMMMPAMSKYSQTEKNFLKACKLVREIQKLVESQTVLEKNQLDKIAKKPEALQEVCTMLDHIPEDSDLRQKNEDVVEVARAQMNALEPPKVMGKAEVAARGQRGGRCHALRKAEKRRSRE